MGGKGDEREFRKLSIGCIPHFHGIGVRIHDLF
jgi:hypothetical protein